MIAEELKTIYADLARESVLADKELVFGDGDPNSKIVLVGEAPGAEEVKQLRPFVGKAGKNLDEFIDILGISRQDLYITNAVKFRPTKMSEKGRLSNRPPTKEEVRACAECLKKELAAISPRVVVTLGNTSLRAVTGDDKLTIGAVHGQPMQLGESTLFALYHPASIIYRRELKAVYEEDVRNLGVFLRKTGLI